MSTRSLNHLLDRLYPFETGLERKALLFAAHASLSAAAGQRAPLQRAAPSQPVAFPADLLPLLFEHVADFATLLALRLVCRRFRETAFGAGVSIVLAAASQLSNERADLFPKSRQARICEAWSLLFPRLRCGLALFVPGFGRCVSLSLIANVMLFIILFLSPPPRLPAQLPPRSCLSADLYKSSGDQEYWNPLLRLTNLQRLSNHVAVPTAAYSSLTSLRDLSIRIEPFDKMHPLGCLSQIVRPPAAPSIWCRCLTVVRRIYGSTAITRPSPCCRSSSRCTLL